MDRPCRFVSDGFAFGCLRRIEKPECGGSRESGNWFPDNRETPFRTSVCVVPQ